MASTFSLLIQLSLVILINSIFSYCEKLKDNNETAERLSTKNFYLMHGAFEILNDDNTNEPSSTKSKLNPPDKTKPTFGYAIFTMTDDVKSIYEDIIKFEFKNYSNSNHQTLVANTVYFGSGPKNWKVEAAKHVTIVDNVLSGQVNSALPIHWFLAKGFLQGLFENIIAVPFMDCLNYPSCAYSEAALIYTHLNSTMNDNSGKLSKFIHKLWPDPEDPLCPVKQLLSKEALQFVSEINVESGLRLMSREFGEVLPLGQDMSEKEFGTTVYSHNDDGSIILLPFDKYDFKICVNKIVKKRLANDAMFFMKSKLAPTPYVLKVAEKDLKLFLDFFVKENAENYLSTWLLKIYQIVNQAKLSSDLDAYFENIVELKINMFQAAFEQYLFTKLFKNNKEVMNCKNNKPKNGKIILEIPDSFPFCEKTAKRKKDNTGDGTCSRDGCPKPLKVDLSDAHHKYSSTGEGEDGNHFHTCPVCRTSHISAKALETHTKEPFHKYMLIAQTSALKRASSFKNYPLQDTDSWRELDGD